MPAAARVSTQPHRPTRAAPKPARLVTGRLLAESVKSVALTIVLALLALLALPFGILIASGRSGSSCCSC